MGNHLTVGIETDRKAYFPGDKLTGNILLTVVEPVKLASLHLKISGWEKTHWVTMNEEVRIVSPTTVGSAKVREVVQRRQVKNGVNKFYLQKEQVFEFPDEAVPSGHHKYPFSVQLPENMKPACEGLVLDGRNGHGSFADVQWSLAYTLKGVVVARGLHRRKRTEIDFTLLPIPSITAAPAKIVQQTTVRVGGFCGSSKVIKEELRLDKDGYLPGELASIKARDGESGRRVCLVKTLTLRGSCGNVLSDVEVLTTAELGEFGEAKIQVPSAPATCDGTIVSLTYAIEMAGASGSKVVLPVKIYTKPEQRPVEPVRAVVIEEPVKLEKTPTIPEEAKEPKKVKVVVEESKPVEEANQIEIKDVPIDVTLPETIEDENQVIGG